MPYPEIGFSDGRSHSLFFIGSMGLVNLPTGMVHFYGKLVGKYTGFWLQLVCLCASEAILCEELIPDESTLEELTDWAKENKLPMRFREGRLATDHW